MVNREGHRGCVLASKNQDMTGERIKELHDADFEIGNHTRHPDELRLLAT
jgi:hypothetical protein